MQKEGVLLTFKDNSTALLKVDIVFDDESRLTPEGRFYPAEAAKARREDIFYDLAEMDTFEIKNGKPMKVTHDLEISIKKIDSDGTIKGFEEGGEIDTRWSWNYLKDFVLRVKFVDQEKFYNKDLKIIVLDSSNKEIWRKIQKINAKTEEYIDFPLSNDLVGCKGIFTVRAEILDQSPPLFVTKEHSTLCGE